MMIERRLESLKVGIAERSEKQKKKRVVQFDNLRTIRKLNIKFNYENPILADHLEEKNERFNFMALMPIESLKGKGKNLNTSPSKRNLSRNVLRSVRSET